MGAGSGVGAAGGSLITVHVLTEGFRSPNGRAFLFPLVVHRRSLEDCGICLQIFNNKNDKLYDCDVLIVESKYHSSQWQDNTERVLSAFAEYRERTAKVLYFDITDSSSWDHAYVLPYVDGYYKNQLLKDQSLYLEPMYGNRIYSDYCHRKFGVKDESPEYSEPIDDPGQLKKLGVGWNSGLANYSLYGPYQMALYQRFPVKHLLRFPQQFIEPGAARENDLSCRMGLTYERRTVAWQRLRIQERLQKYLKTDKLSRRKYFKELAASKVVISPFGLGEITLKDFEVFLTGGLLLKPDMSHMETWPDLCRDGETIVTFKWDMDDLEEVVENVLVDYPKYVEIASQGQEQYFKYLAGPDAAELFSRHLLNILRFGENVENLGVIDSSE